MIFAYILLKTNLWKLRFIREGSKLFTYKGKQYNMDPSCIMRKKLFGIKKIDIIFYMQDVRDPLNFKGGKVINQQVPVDILAHFMNKIKLGLFGEIGIIFTVINFILLLIVIGVLTGAIEV